MALVIPEQFMGVKEPHQRVVDILQRSFDFDIKNRISVRADPNQFKFLADSSVYEQVRGNANTFFEVYWDDVWVCDFDEEVHYLELERRFFTSFAELYEQGKVAFNEQEDYEYEDKHNKSLREAKKMSEKTPEEQLAKQAIIETIQEDKEKLDKKKKELQNKL